jgi:arylsulfatase A-like enzyme
LWDTQVPALMWANKAWRRHHAAAWSALEAGRPLPIMHMDLVPTLLGAAGIRYEEPRADVVD